MGFDLWYVLYKLLVGIVYVVVGLALVLLASMVWHFGEIVMRGWFA